MDRLQVDLRRRAQTRNQLESLLPPPGLAHRARHAVSPRMGGTTMTPELDGTAFGGAQKADGGAAIRRRVCLSSFTIVDDHLGREVVSVSPVFVRWWAFH